ncbi:MAG TPA: tripartite tricarboxylate transporter substrate binding protein [Xanthobacteraceae bacterium]|jgi:tripartite-type tricarboxylate transporter receptor subunit TctC|nr:tripartite tricarboxylate transporter substrate binding protein [Xanthobacteraceae bacterium]
MKRHAIAALTAFLCLIGTAHAQNYPDRPVHVLVGFAAGSGPDVLARAVAAQLGADLGQNFIVENRTGANGTIATNVVAQAAPDGYTLLSTSDSIAPTPFIYKQLPYDIFKDITPIGTIGILDGLLMLVNPSSPAHNVGEFIAYAKTHRVLYGSPGIGNGLHLAAAQFNKTVGLNMEHVPFKGASEVSAALLGGNIDVMFVTPPSVLGLVKDGKLRALAFTGSKPFPELPDVPLLKATVPDYPPIENWNMFFAPAKTPQAIIDKLNAAIRHALTEPAVINVTQKSGFMPDGRTPEQTAAYFRVKVEAAKKSVEAAGIEPN